MTTIRTAVADRLADVATRMQDSAIANVEANTRAGHPTLVTEWTLFVMRCGDWTHAAADAVRPRSAR